MVPLSSCPLFLPEQGYAVVQGAHQDVWVTVVVHVQPSTDGVPKGLKPAASHRLALYHLQGAVKQRRSTP